MGKGGIVKSIPTHVTDNLKMLHRYNTGSVVPVSDGSIYFDGSASHAYSAAETITGDITISLWAKPDFDNTRGGNTLFNFGGQSSTDGYLWLYIDYDDVRAQYVPDGVGNYAYWRWDDHYESGEFYKWTHWTYVYDKSETRPMTIYKNGASLGVADSESGEDGGAATGAGADITSETWTIGAYNYASESAQFKGNICNFGVWNSVLTQAQIKSIMFSDYESAKSAISNPVHWWAFNEAVGETTAVDQGSAGLNLTVVGS